MREPDRDASASAEMIVTKADLASALQFEATDIYPAVFATSRMVALMEVASSRILRPFLDEGELSVGVAIEATHTAPTPSGAKVVAISRYVGREEKFFLFEVVVHDGAGEIGRGRHKRAVVSPPRLLETAQRRNPNALPRGDTSING